MNDIWKMMFGAAAGWIAAHFIVGNRSDPSSLG